MSKMPTNADLDKRLSIQETKLDAVSHSVEEIKRDMKEHRNESSKNNDKLANRFDRLLWAVVVGMTGIIIKLLFLSN